MSVASSQFCVQFVDEIGVQLCKGYLPVQFVKCVVSDLCGTGVECRHTAQDVRLSSRSLRFRLPSAADSNCSWCCFMISYFARNLHQRNLQNADLSDVTAKYSIAAVFGSPHTYSFTFSFNCAGQTVPSLHSLACERFYRTRADKTEGNRLVQFVI